MLCKIFKKSIHGVGKIVCWEKFNDKNSLVRQRNILVFGVTGPILVDTGLRGRGHPYQYFMFNLLSPQHQP